MVGDIAIKVGTKLTNNPKDFMLRVRLDQKTLQQLDIICQEENQPRSKVVRNLIKERAKRKMK